MGTTGFAGKGPNFEETGYSRCFKVSGDHLGDEWETGIRGFAYHEKYRTHLLKDRSYPLICLLILDFERPPGTRVYTSAKVHFLLKFKAQRLK